MGTTIGLKDSMKTIQSKLDKGGDIVFTKGTYKITKQLLLAPNSNINLNEAVLQRKASIQSIFLNKVVSLSTAYSAAGNIVIKNGTFEGMGGYSYDNLVTFFHSHDITIDSCIFKDILMHGIELNSTRDTVIKNCQFLGYNLRSKDDAYNECIQLDHAGFSGFVLSGSTKSSKCYDGTCCKNIEIKNCYFGKSNYRDYPYACIGQHSQLRNAIVKHTNIKIHDNEFYCKLNSDLKQPCLSIINMVNVEVVNNKFDCSRVARIYSKSTSYKFNGTSVTAGEGDGICSNITITKNTISSCKNSSAAFHVYNQSSKNSTHTSIIKKGNTYI